MQSLLDTALGFLPWFVLGFALLVVVFSAGAWLKDRSLKRALTIFFGGAVMTLVLAYGVQGLLYMTTAAQDELSGVTSNTVVDAPTVVIE